MKNANEDYLSYNRTNCLKGICAVFIVIHHLYQVTQICSHNITVRNILQNMGRCFVSIFFFCSGYGLMAVYTKKGKDYIKKFPQNRIIPFYVKCIILAVIYSIFYLIIDKTVDIKTFLSTFVFGGTIIKYGWYLQAILYMYILFYIVYKFVKKQKFQFIGLSIGILVYYGLCKMLNLSETWYISIIGFLIGVIWSYNKEKIDCCLKSKKILYILILILFLIAYGLFEILTKCKLNLIQKNIIRLALNIVFVFWIISMSKGNIIRQNKMLDKIGNLSFEIYVLQGLFILFYRSDKVYIDNLIIYIILVVISTIVFAKVLNKLFSKIDKIIKERLNIYMEG